METKQVIIVAMVVLASSILAIAPAQTRADDITLTLLPVAGSPGDTITIYGDITDNTPTAIPIYLNSESFLLNSPFFLADSNSTLPFLLNAPLFFSSPGITDSGLIPLFTFTLDPGISSGSYPGNLLQILGGTDTNAENLLASADFSVTTVPEPPTLVLAAMGLLAMLLKTGPRLVLLLTGGRPLWPVVRFWS
jgi:hypothetical protein